MKQFVPVITIDGPSGVGKSTLCKIISNKLKWNMLESGLIYRKLALLILNNRFNFSKNNLNFLSNYLLFYNIDKINNFDFKLNYHNTINQEYIGNFASQLACFPFIRNILLYQQRLFRNFPGLVTSGRDMGTVVFPDSIIKFFLTADLRTRVQRKFLKFKKQGIRCNFNKLLYIMKQRDDRDQNRKHSPLLPDKNSIIIDSTYLNIYQVKTLLMYYINKFQNFN